jgi:hypothetical protein
METADFPTDTGLIRTYSRRQVGSRPIRLAKEQFMSPIRIVGVIALVIGIVLLILGLQATDSLGERLSNTFTGHWSDKTNFYIVAGVAGVVGGLLMAGLGGGRSLRA